MGNEGAGASPYPNLFGVRRRTSEHFFRSFRQVVPFVYRILIKDWLLLGETIEEEDRGTAPSSIFGGEPGFARQTRLKARDLDRTGRGVRQICRAQRAQALWQTF